MSKIQFDWYDRDEGIMIWRFEMGWNWDMYFNASRRANTLIEEVAPMRVDFIADLHQSGKLPSNVLSVVRQVSLARPDNWGATVVMGGNTFVEMMVGVGRRVNRDLAHRYMTANTLDEAVQLIHKIREESASE